MKQTEALKLALEALEQTAKEMQQERGLCGDYPNFEKTIKAIEEHLAQPEQEPVAWGFQNSAITGSNRWMMLREEIPSNDQYGGALWTPLYTTPPTQQGCSQRTAAEGEDSKAWVGLTKQQRIDIIERLENEHSQHELIDAIEAKLKEKNT